MASQQTKTETAITVSEAVEIAKLSLETLRLRVIGEVSGFTGAKYPTKYFSLKDGDATLKCIIWKNVYDAADVDLQDGQEIEVVGKFSVFPKRGEMNFHVSKLHIAGEGQLRIELAQREARLRAEGLFDEQHKRTIPVFPQKIAVVTSPAGAVIHDITKALGRRWPVAQVLLYGVRVEGTDAVSQICAGITAADQSDADLIILARGGGSFEDLLPFSDEAVVRAIVDVQTPLISGIGHQPDISLADHVADMHAATPTAAAEAASSPSIADLQQLLDSSAVRMQTVLNEKIRSSRRHLDALASRPVFAGPEELLQVRAMLLDSIVQRMTTVLAAGFGTERQRIVRAQERLLHVGPHLTARERTQLERATGTLDALSPLKVLGRGYAMVFESGDSTQDESTVRRKVIDSVSCVQVGQAVKVELHDGQLDCEVKGIANEPII